MSDSKYASAWPTLRAFARAIGSLVLIVGCATTRPPSVYLLSPEGIGVAILSPPPSEVAAVESNLVDAEGPAAGGNHNIFGARLFRWVS